VYKSHLLSKKHLNFQTSTQEYSHICEYCTKKYRHASGLCKHKKNCKKLPPPVNVLLERIAQLENKVLENQTNNTVNNITNNITNNIININLNYLNTHCGNALNIGQFVESIVFTKDDYNEIAKCRTIAQGATNVLNKKLENLSVEKYPFHCSAVEINKPTIFFVRDENQWNPESQSDIEYQQNFYEEVNTNVKKLGMMRFFEEFNKDLYDKYMELSEKYPNLKRIDDKMFFSGRSTTHIEMLREIPNMESLVLDISNATNIKNSYSDSLP
jgi:hypothetical protein